MCQGKAQGFGSGAQSVLPCSSLICVATEFLWGGSLSSGFGKGVMLLEGDSLAISSSGFNGGCLAGVGTLPRCTHTHSYLFTLSTISLPPLTLPPFPHLGSSPSISETPPEIPQTGPAGARSSGNMSAGVCIHTHTIQTHRT